MEHLVPEICSRTDGLTVRQTDTVIAILRFPISGGVTNNHFITCRLFTLHVGSGSSIQAPSLPTRWLWPGGKTLICRRRHNTLLNELVFVVGCVPRRVVVKRMPNVHKTWHGPCVKMAKSELINRAIDRSCGRTIALQWNNLWPRLMCLGQVRVKVVGQIQGFYSYRRTFRNYVYIGWQYLCQLVSAAILWVKLLEMFVIQLHT